jgi:PAS domain S-box-containing protein
MNTAKTYTILNVDDNEAGRYARTRILERAGYRVIEAETGTDALRLAKQELPQAVLLDVRLPDINGLEVCHAIKTEPLTADIMILQVSATHITGADRIHGLAGGADTYLTEPVEPGELIAALEALLRLYDREQENRQLISQLRESENQFRTMFELSAVGQAQVDLTTNRFVLVNNRFCEITGYSEAELMARSPASIIHPDDRLTGVESYLRLIRGGTGEYSQEHRLLRKDGETIWVQVSLRVIHDSAGRPVRTTSVIQDITSQKTAEETLRRVHESLSLAQRAASGGVWDYEIPSGKTYVSPEYRLLYGLEDTELVSYERWLSLVLEEDRQSMADAGLRLFSLGEEWNVEFRIDHPTRGRRWLAGLGWLQRDDKGVPLRFSGVNIDITELKRAEEAVRLSEAEFRATFEYSAIGRAQIDPATARIMRANRKLCQMLGYSSEELIGKNFVEITQPDDREEDALTEQSFYRGEISNFTTEKRYLHKNGHAVWCAVTASMINDQQGRPLIATADILDISERKRIQLNAEFLRRLGSEMAPLSDADEIADLAVRRTAEHIGMSRCGLATIGGENSTGFTYQWASDDSQFRALPSLVDFVTAAVNAPLKSGDAFTIDDVGRDPRTQPFAANLAALGIGSCAAAPHLSEGKCEALIVATAPQARNWSTDEVRCLQNVIARVWPVVKRARAQAALQQSEERARQQLSELEAIYRTVPVGLCVFDTSLRYQRINEQLAEMNGLPAAAHVGKSVSEVVPSLEQQANRALRQVLETGQNYHGEFCGDTPAQPGAMRYWEQSWFPLHDSAGRITSVGVVAEETTERKRTEKALLEADRRKDEFLAMLGHELRNPLGIISTAIQLLQLKGPADKNLIELHNMIDGQVQYMRRLIDDLLDVSRITTGKIRLEKERCDLGEILTNTANSYRDNLEANGLRLQIDHPNQPMFVNCDETRIAQVLGNLLHNAGKFTDSGGKVVVKLEANNDGKSAIISVKDTGVGMDADTLARIFDIFNQADHSIARSREGLGLGLALVKGLVELHGGEVSAASDGVGRGSEFTIRLPLAEPLSPRLPIKQNGFLKVRPYRILVIEDNRTAASSIQMFLSELGHEVEIANNGPAGISIAERIKPEVVLCDIGLPGVDGYEVARRLRQNKELGKIYLVAVSGYGQEQDKRRALEAGFNAHFAKPVDFKKLQHLLSELDPMTNRIEAARFWRQDSSKL